MTENKLIDKIYDSECVIVIDDTHRWVDSDGFYEMSINIVCNGYECNLDTIIGDESLEEDYSPHNPQRTYVSDVSCYADFSDEDLVNKIINFLDGNYTELDCNTGNSLQYQHFL